VLQEKGGKSFSNKAAYRGNPKERSLLLWVKPVGRRDDPALEVYRNTDFLNKVPTVRGGENIKMRREPGKGIRSKEGSSLHRKNYHRTL